MLLLRTCGASLHRTLVARLSTTTVAVQQQIKPAPETPAASPSKKPTADLPPATTTTNTGQQDTHIRTHYARLRKPARPQPLLRDFFVGAVDTEMLTYPEPITRDDMQLLDASVRRHTELFASAPPDAGSWSALRQAGVFGLDVPAAWGGSNCTVTELTRHAEVEALADVGVAAALNAHRLLVRALVECGSAEQQERFLPRLASGELTGAVAFYEALPSATTNGSAAVAPSIFRTRATGERLASATEWRLHGDKNCITGAPHANLFLVFAQTQTDDLCGDPTSSISAFLVDRHSTGVHILPADRTLAAAAATAADQATLQLRGCAAEPLGAAGDGATVAQRTLRAARLQTAVVALALQRRILAGWSRYAIRSGATEQELLRSRLSRAFATAYALESALYLTTGVLDAYEAADVDVETAALAILAKESLLAAGTMGLEFAGAQATVSGAPDALVGDAELRDALQACAQGETSDSLRMFVGLSGVKHAGESLSDVVRKVRNPLYNPSFIFRRLFDTPNIEEPKCTLQLNHHLHPSLDPAAQWLEQSILRLQAVTETLLSRHGVQVIDRQCELQRLATVAVQCYAAFAAVARASRSYCIGLQHADYEMLTANAYTFDAQVAVKRLALELSDGPFLTGDMNQQKLAAQVLRSGGYFAAHPLLRNF